MFFRQSQVSLKSILLEFGGYIIILILGVTLLPICNFFYLTESEALVIEPRYMNDFPIAYFIPYAFSLIFFAFFSSKKNILVAVNLILFVLSILLFLYIELSFGFWSQSPIHPELSYGYWLSNLALFAFLIRSVMLQPHLNKMELNSKISNIFISVLILSIVIPIFFAFRPSEKPKLDKEQNGERWYVEDASNRRIYVEYWDYISYNTKVEKYFSSDTSTHVKGPIDSVKITYFDKELKKKVSFTTKSNKGTLDIEKLLKTKVKNF